MICLFKHNATNHIPSDIIAPCVLHLARKSQPGASAAETAAAGAQAAVPAPSSASAETDLPNLDIDCGKEEIGFSISEETITCEDNLDSSAPDASADVPDVTIAELQDSNDMCIGLSSQQCGTNGAQWAANATTSTLPPHPPIVLIQSSRDSRDICTEIFTDKDDCLVNEISFADGASQILQDKIVTVQHLNSSCIEVVQQQQQQQQQPPEFCVLSKLGGQRENLPSPPPCLPPLTHHSLALRPSKPEPTTNDYEAKGFSKEGNVHGVCQFSKYDSKETTDVIVDAQCNFGECDMGDNERRIIASFEVGVPKSASVAGPEKAPRPPLLLLTLPHPGPEDSDTNTSLPPCTTPPSSPPPLQVDEQTDDSNVTSVSNKDITEHVMLHMSCTSIPVNTNDTIPESNHEVQHKLYSKKNESFKMPPVNRKDINVGGFVNHQIQGLGCGINSSSLIGAEVHYSKITPAPVVFDYKVSFNTSLHRLDSKEPSAWNGAQDGQRNGILGQRNGILDEFWRHKSKMKSTWMQNVQWILRTVNWC